MKSLILLGSIVLLGAGCVTIKNPAPRFSHNELFPENNTTQTVELGSSLVRKLISQKKNAINIEEEVKWASERYPPQKAVQSYSDKKYDYFGPLEGPYQYKEVLMGISKDRKKAALLWKDVNFRIKKFPKLKFYQTIDENSDYFKQELIFNGKTGDSVKLMYRESRASRLPRDVSQNLQYDLKSSKEISFKGARIVIIDASNQKLTYRVISNFE